MGEGGKKIKRKGKQFIFANLRDETSLRFFSDIN